VIDWLSTGITITAKNNAAHKCLIINFEGFIWVYFNDFNLIYVHK